MKNLKDKLKTMGACEDAVEWVGEKDIKEAWATCHRGDWMLWLCERMKGSKGWPSEKEIMAIGIACARKVQHIMKDDRSITALDVAQRYVDGNASKEELDAAWDAASAAARDAASAAARDAASAAAWAAALAAAGAAASAAAGAAALAAALAAAGDAAWDAALADQANICRLLNIPGAK